MWAGVSASFGSFFVSPGSKRMFSSSRTSAGPRGPQVRSTSPSLTPGASFTLASSSSPRRLATGASERLGSRSPFGRPRWDIRTSAAPRSRSSSIVGRAARMRVSSATTRLPPSSLSGTLKSTRTRTRRPFTGASRTLALSKDINGRETAASGGQNLAGQLDAAVGVAPLVVVPADRLDQLAVADHHRLRGVEDRGARVADDVGGDDRVLGIGEDPLHRPLGSCFDGGVDLLGIDRLRGGEGEVDDRAGRDRRPHCEPVQLAVQL